MTKEITLKELLELVTVKQNAIGRWCIINVHDDVLGNVEGNVWGNVHDDVLGDVNGNVLGDVNGNVLGDVNGNVLGDVEGNVEGNVNGTINGREWQFIETPKDKLKRLIEEKGDEELLKAFNQLENN